MAVFAICSKFVEDCGSDGRLLRNTLMYFVHDSPLRIAIDSGKQALSEYASIAEDNDLIANWLGLLADRGVDAFDKVSVAEPLGGAALFWEIANGLFPPKQLVCSSRQHYSLIESANSSVTLIDRAAAKIQIEHACQGHGSNIITYISTTGDNSPIIQGDDNATGT